MIQQNQKSKRTKALQQYQADVSSLKSNKNQNQNSVNNKIKTSSDKQQIAFNTEKLITNQFSPKYLQKNYQQNDTKILQKQRYNYFFNKFKNMKALQQLQINDLRQNEKNFQAISAMQNQKTKEIVLANQLYNSNKIKNKKRQPKWHQEFKVFKQKVSQEAQAINKNKDIQKKIYNYQNKRSSIGSAAYDNNFIYGNAQAKRKQNFYRNMNNISYFSERSNSNSNNIDQSRNYAINSITTQLISENKTYYSFQSHKQVERGRSPKKTSLHNQSPRPPRHPNSKKQQKLKYDDRNQSPIHSRSPEHWKKYRFQNQANSPKSIAPPKHSFLSPSNQSRPTTSSIQQRNSQISKLQVSAQYPSSYRKNKLTAQIAMRKKQQQIKRTLLNQELTVNKDITQQQALLQQFHKQSSPLHVGGERQTIHLRNNLKSPKSGHQNNSDLGAAGYIAPMIHQEEIGQYYLSGMLGADITTNDISSKKQSIAQQVNQFPPAPPSPIPSSFPFQVANSKILKSANFNSSDMHSNSIKGSRKVSPFNYRNGSRTSLQLDKRKQSQQQDSSRNILPAQNNDISKGKRKGSYGVLMMSQNQAQLLQKRDTSTARGVSRQRGASIHGGIKQIDNASNTKKSHFKFVMKQGFNYKNDILTPGGVNFADQNSEEDISGWG